LASIAKRIAACPFKSKIGWFSMSPPIKYKKMPNNLLNFPFDLHLCAASMGEIEIKAITVLFTNNSFLV